MRNLTLTTLALAFTFAAASTAQATPPQYLPYNHIEGIGNAHLPKVRVHPPVIKIKSKINLKHVVEFGQANGGDTLSVQRIVTEGPKEVTGTSAAIGNTANVDVKGGVFVEGNQKNLASSVAKQRALVLGAKEVELTTSAIGNAATVTTNGDVVVDLNQVNKHGHVKSHQVSGVFSHQRHGLGDVAINSAAIGNTLSVEFGRHDEALISSRQINYNDVTSINVAAVGGKFDSAEITSAAIGNALNITNK